MGKQAPKAKVVIQKPVAKATVRASVRPVEKSPKADTSHTPKAIVKAMQTGTQDRLLDSDKRKKLIKLISENLGKPKPLSMYEMMLQAGYAESTAKQQTTILVSVRQEPEVQNLITKLKEHQTKMLKRMDETIGRASYGNVAFALPAVSRTIELLEGRPTERIDILSDEEKAELDDIIEDNA